MVSSSQAEARGGRMEGHFQGPGATPTITAHFPVENVFVSLVYSPRILWQQWNLEREIGHLDKAQQKLTQVLARYEGAKVEQSVKLLRKETEKMCERFGAMKNVIIGCYERTAGQDAGLAKEALDALKILRRFVRCGIQLNKDARVVLQAETTRARAHESIENAGKILVPWTIKFQMIFQGDSWERLSNRSKSLQSSITGLTR